MSRIPKERMEKALQQLQTISPEDYEKIKGIANIVRLPRSFLFKTPDEYGKTGGHDLVMPSDDGIPLEAWYIPAKGGESDKLVIFNHALPMCRAGFPGHFGEPWSHFDAVEIDFVIQYKHLTDAGYNVLTIAVDDDKAPFLIRFPSPRPAFHPVDCVLMGISVMTPSHPRRQLRSGFDDGFVGRVDISRLIVPNLNGICHRDAFHWKCPCQESNLVYDLRKVACIHHTPVTDIKRDYRGLPCVHHTRRPRLALLSYSSVQFFA